MRTNAPKMKFLSIDRRWRSSLQPGELIPESTFFIAVW